jgi:hypothetical protein
MSPEEINKRIAIACKLDIVDNPNPKDRPEAWKTAFFTKRAATIRKKSWPSSAVVKVIPNYYGDLNAMHEAETHIMDENSIEYVKWLNKLSCPWHASAPKRAEAFLRTINQWEEVA